jgi:nitroreductase
LEFMEVIKRRRSIRKYKQDPVPDEIITQILEAARLAPSGSNRQPWHFIVVKDPETKKKLGLHSWAAEAPVVLVGCIDPTEGRWYVIDGSIAFEHIVLAATNFGLGTCWMGRFLENLGETDERIKRVLDIPEHMRVLAVTPLGFPAKEPEQRKIKTLHEIVHYEKF